MQTPTPEYEVLIQIYSRNDVDPIVSNKTCSTLVDIHTTAQELLGSTVKSFRSKVSGDSMKVDSLNTQHPNPNFHLDDHTSEPTVLQELLKEMKYQTSLLSDLLDYHVNRYPRGFSKG